MTHLSKYLCLLALIIVTFTGGDAMAWWKKPLEKDCLVCGLRHVYHKMKCEKQFKTVSNEVNAKVEGIKQLSVDFHTSQERLQEVSQMNIQLVTLLRGLCNDWNAGAICEKEYQKIKTKYFETLARLDNLSVDAKGIKKGATMGGAFEGPTIKQWQEHLDEYIGKVKELEAEMTAEERKRHIQIGESWVKELER